MAAMLEQLVLAAPPDALALHAACISPSLEDRVEMIRSLSSSVAMALMGEPADQHAERVLDDLAFVRHAWAPLCEVRCCLLIATVHLHLLYYSGAFTCWRRMCPAGSRIFMSTPT